MINLARSNTKTLLTLQRQYQAKHAAKLAAMTRHQPGTAYHTRAQREAQTCAENLAQIAAELKRRGVR